MSRELIRQYLIGIKYGLCETTGKNIYINNFSS